MAFNFEPSIRFGRACHVQPERRRIMAWELRRLYANARIALSFCENCNPSRTWRRMNGPAPVTILLETGLLVPY